MDKFSFSFFNRKKLGNQIFLWTMLVIGLMILFNLAPTLSQPEYISADDYIQTWASGRLNLESSDPYDSALIRQFHIALGNTTIGNENVSIMLTPPWTFLITMPFSLLKYSIGRLAWLFFCCLLLLISSIWLWQIYSGDQKSKYLALIVSIIFGPTISALEKGQITVVILIGIVGFLYFSSVYHNDWLAGVFLALTTIKPQLLILFWIVLICWIIHEHRWVIAISLLSTIILSTAITMVFNPSILEQYIRMISTYNLSNWANPTIGSYLRYFEFGIDQFWLQFLPAILGGIWIFYFWYVRRQTWDWKNELPLILIASIITSPYMWTYDQVILVPVVIQASFWIAEEWKKLPAITLGVFFLVISFLDLILHMRFDEFWFIWLAPAILIWYLITRWWNKITIKKSPCKMILGKQ
jgi:hypothetical protein